MRTCWKACRVCFIMPQVSSHLDVAIKSYAWISQDCSAVYRDRMLVELAVQNCTNLQRFMVPGIYTLLGSSWSLVSHPRNGSSFGLPNKKLWSVYLKLLWRPTVTRSQFGNPFRGDLSHCLPSETLFRFHTYLAGLLQV